MAMARVAEVAIPFKTFPDGHGLKDASTLKPGTEISGQGATTEMIEIFASGYRGYVGIYTGCYSRYISPKSAREFANCLMSMADKAEQAANYTPRYNVFDENGVLITTVTGRGVYVKPA